MTIRKYLAARKAVGRPPGTLGHDAWCYLRGTASDGWLAFLCRAMDRLATERMRHAALLLGADFMQGIGEARGLVSRIPEFTLAEEIFERCQGRDVTDADRSLAVGLFELERMRWIPDRRGLSGYTRW